MKIKHKIYALVVLILLIPALQFRINTVRKEFVPTGDIFIALTPGEFAGTLLLGGFRGIAVDILWLRARRLQEEEKYFELIALTDMIARLQPQDRMVWEFNSWNRAYNVPVYFVDREDRWKWVKSGIELNMEGIRRMPYNWKLKKHLGFMFFHKCADYPEETLRDFGEDNFTLARKYYSLARQTAENPDDIPLYVDRMIIHTYERQGDFETAKKLYDEHLSAYPDDKTARENRDDFLRNKVEFKGFTDEILIDYKNGKYESVVEIYEDIILGKFVHYEIPVDILEPIILSYHELKRYEDGLECFLLRIGFHIRDKDTFYRLFSRFKNLYNEHYTSIFIKLFESGKNDEINSIYDDKFTKKKVEISLKNGIIVLESNIRTDNLEKARDLYVSLEAFFPEEKSLLSFKSVVFPHNKENKEE